MQIDRLRLTNFRQHELTEIELGAGLTGIIGPNGAGKTTLLEAIAWVMYGTKAARGAKDSIRRRGAPPRSKVEVEMEFTLGPRRYRVVRGLNSAELFQDGESTPIANSLDSVTDKITRLLGMSRDEFFNTYFTGQKELAVMAAMSAPERAQFLSRVLGYERIRAAQDRLKERRAGLRVRLDALQSGLPNEAILEEETARATERERAARDAELRSAALLASAEAKLAQVRPAWETIQRTRERAVALDTERRVLESRLASAREKAADLARQAAEAERARLELDGVRVQLAPLGALREEAARFDRLSAAYVAQRAAVAQLEEVRRRLTDLEASVARLPESGAADAARERVVDVRAQLAAASLEVEERRTAWVRDSQDARTKRQGLLDQYQDLKDQQQRIEAAGAGGACPTCTRPLGAEFDNVLGVLNRQLEEVLVNGNYFKQRIEQLKDEPPELDAADSRRIHLEQELSKAVAEQATLEAQAAEQRAAAAAMLQVKDRAAKLEVAAGVDATAYDPARHDKVRAGLRALEPMALRAQRVEPAAEQAAPLAARAADASNDVTALGNSVTALAQEFAAIGYTEAAFNALQLQEKDADRARRDAELAAVRARGESQAAAEATAAVQRRREDSAARRADAARTAADLMLHQELDRALTDLRTDLNQALRPELSELASGFVQDLTAGRYTELELDESYMATLLDDGDPKTVISGGEEDIANLALRLAISQMIAERAGQPLSLLVLDEIFGSLDEERRTAVVDLLRTLADRFPQVILITHIDAVRDGFDRVIRVGYDVARGVSTVRDEPLGGQDVAA